MRFGLGHGAGKPAGRAIDGHPWRLLNLTVKFQEEDVLLRPARFFRALGAVNSDSFFGSFLLKIELLTSKQPQGRLADRLLRTKRPGEEARRFQA
jgi:hypothetical protein